MSEEQVMQWKHEVIRAYLVGMGDPSTPADVEALLLDASLGVYSIAWLSLGGPLPFGKQVAQVPNSLALTALDEKALRFERVGNKLICNSLDQRVGIGLNASLNLGGAAVTKLGGGLYTLILVPEAEAVDLEFDNGFETIVDGVRHVLRCVHYSYTGNWMVHLHR